MVGRLANTWLLWITLAVISLAPTHTKAAAESESAGKSVGPDRVEGAPEVSPTSPGKTPDPSGASISAPAEAGDPLDDEFDYELFDQPVGYPDPLEPANRGLLRINIEIDRWILDPITRLYGFLFPEFAKQAIRCFFQNLNTPPVLVNDLIQLEWTDAGITFTRFVINSSVGLAGLFEVAESMGLERHESDFGQTLSLAGLPSGPYLMLPIFGPSTMRDGGGDIVDSLMRPVTWIFPVVSPEQLFYGSGAGLSTREENFEKLKALKESSVDFYAALRSAYYQNRSAEIWSRREGRRDDWSGVYSPSARSSALRPTSASSVSNPSLFNTEEYSERRSASSLTVPFK